jgi:nucleotide-binding universal stress UspA family protein
MQEAEEEMQGSVWREKGRTMFQHLLVLLDGSGRAELALPVAARLARATGASLTMVRMVTLPPDFSWSKLEPPFRDGKILTTETLQASTYLKGKAWELERAGIAVQTHLLPGLAFPQLQVLKE